MVAFVAWLIRLESKATGANDKVEKLSVDVYDHHASNDIHHNASDLDRRFKELKDDIIEIKSDIKEGLKEIGHRMDRLFTKQ